jgi:hypothetical protein
MGLGRFADDPLRMEKARNTVCEKLHWKSANLRKSQVIRRISFIGIVSPCHASPLSKCPVCLAGNEGNCS